MKSSPIRKRYILIYFEDPTGNLREIEETIRRVFRAKRKYASGNYAIFLTNQFYKDQFIEFVNSRIKGARTVITSGTIKKCKDAIAKRSGIELVNAGQ